MAIRSFVVLILAVATAQAAIAYLPAEEHSASSDSKEQVSLLATMLTMNGFNDICVAATLDICSIGQASLSASLVEAAPASSSPLPAEEHASSGIMDQRSLLSAMLVMTGHSRACVATALDVCKSGQVESSDGSLTEEARGVVQQVSAAVTKWESQLSTAVNSIESQVSVAVSSIEPQLSAAVNSIESQVRAAVNSIEPQLSTAVNTSESQLSASIKKSESQLSDAIRVWDSQLSAFMNKSESQLSAFINKSDSQFSAAENKSESETSAAENKSESLPRHCRDLQASGDRGIGPRQVYPDPARPLHSVTVVCDHTVDGGGWTVFQRRTSDAQRQNFTRTWREYEDGFGDTDGGEVWLGLKVLHQLTSTSVSQLRIDLHDYEGEHRWAKYRYFNVHGPETNYRLSVADYSGDAGDSLVNHNGQAFSTHDADHDSWRKSCAAKYKAGWWYGSCVYANLNGYQHVGSDSPRNKGITWDDWKGDSYSLQETAMMTRPA